MTRYAEELNRRIQNGEPVHVTRRWFIECLSKGEPGCQYFSDMSLQEQMFFEKTVNAFAAWQKQQKQKPRRWWRRLRK
jgi:hypothetical protein